MPFSEEKDGGKRELGALSFHRSSLMTTGCSLRGAVSFFFFFMAAKTAWNDPESESAAQGEHLRLSSADPAADADLQLLKSNHLFYRGTGGDGGGGQLHNSQRRIRH